MLSIDEAIEVLKKGEYLTNIEEKQIAKWLEELKTLKENSISKEAFEKMKFKSYQYGYRQGYSKVMVDFTNWLVGQGISRNGCISDGEITDYGKVYAKKYKKQLKEQSK